MLGKIEHCFYILCTISLFSILKVYVGIFRQRFRLQVKQKSRGRRRLRSNLR